MINKVSVSNYRVIGNIETDLTQFSLIVGPNGCGKTTFLNSIIESLSYSILRTEKNNPNKKKSSIHISKTLAGQVLQQLNYKPAPGVVDVTQVIASRVTNRELNYSGISSKMELKSPLTSEHGTFEVSKGVIKSITKYDSDDRLADISLSEINECSFYPASIWNIRLDTSAMRNPAPLSSSKKIALDGSNVAAIIADMKLENEGAFKSILRGLQEIVPAIIDVKITRNAEKKCYELKFDTANEKNIDIRYMSDGTLFTLGLLTLLHVVVDVNALFLIDDLDQGLHPYAQKELIKLLRSLLDKNPEYQIIATTHSPYLLACAAPEEIFCMNLGEDGKSRIAGMTMHKDFEKWREEMNPGEFWSLFGDKWVTDR